jgi:hypothetical protein
MLAPFKVVNLKYLLPLTNFKPYYKNVYNTMTKTTEKLFMEIKEKSVLSSKVYKNRLSCVWRMADITYISFTAAANHGFCWTTTAQQSNRLVLHKLLQIQVAIRSASQNASITIHGWPKTLIKTSQINVWIL